MMRQPVFAPFIAVDRSAIGQQIIQPVDASPDYIVIVNPDGKVFVQCNRPMIPARAVELAKLLVKVAEADRGDELLPMGRMG